MGAPESEVRVVDAMYENAKGRVVVGSGMSNEIQVNIGLRHGRASKPNAFNLSNGTNQQEDKHNRWSEEDCVGRRTCDRCRASGIIGRRTGGVE